MKYFAAVLGLGMWLFVTLLSGVFIIPLIVLMLLDEYWQIPLKLLKVFES